MIDINKRVLDSSIWLHYLHNGHYKKVIDSDEMLYITTLSLFEIKRKLLKEKHSKDKIKISLDLIKKRSIVMCIDEKMADRAAEISYEKNIPTVDALIYTCALLNNAILITTDNDFRGLENVEIVELEKSF